MYCLVFIQIEAAVDGEVAPIPEVTEEDVEAFVQQRQQTTEQTHQKVCTLSLYINNKYNSCI